MTTRGLSSRILTARVMRAARGFSRRGAGKADLKTQTCALPISVVVGVARLPVGQDDDARFELADLDGQGHAGGEGVFQAGVGEVEVVAPLQKHVLAGNLGFGDALLRGTARTHVAGGEVERAGAVA